MANASTYLAFDFGAESGRAVLGHLADGKINLEEIHRFPTGGTRIATGLHWDVLGFFDQIKAALRKANQQVEDLQGIGLDTWGVDFGLLDKDDVLLANPWHYRDERNEGMIEYALETVSKEEIFEATGLQFLPFNTLFQLLSMKKANSSLLESARRLLMIPDLLNFWLTGVKANEFTDASTTMCYDPRKGDWAYDLLEKLGLPARVFGDLVQPGTELGPLHSAVQADTGLGAVPVFAPATHDTGSAVAAVPAEGTDFAYISSGTWSLMGLELPEPIINEAALQYNFTNEGGVEGTIRFLKNIMGLWLVQECRRTWEREGQVLDYGTITQMAAEARPFMAIIDPDDELFLRPGDMPARIRQYCADTGQAVPETKGEIVRVALEGLALKYKWTFEKLQELLGKKLGRIHVVGGGGQNQLLAQFTANACGVPVLVGPYEATALGNVLLQAIGKGELANLKEAREMLRNSFELKEYEPQAEDAWDEAYAKFLEVAKL